MFGTRRGRGGTVLESNLRVVLPVAPQRRPWDDELVGKRAGPKGIISMSSGGARGAIAAKNVAYDPRKAAIIEAFTPARGARTWLPRHPREARSQPGSNPEQDRSRG